MTDNSAMTAAELDELQVRLISCHEYQLAHLPPDLQPQEDEDDATLWKEAADAIAALRRERDAYRFEAERAAKYRQEIADYALENAQMTAAMAKREMYLSRWTTAHLHDDAYRTDLRRETLEALGRGE